MRLKLMAGILAMTALLAGTVLFFSPYAPEVGPMMEIEEIWAIEDAREESDVPLVTALENNGMRLGYDAQENTFYCTLGMGHEEAWPDIHLTAPDAKGVSLCFVDDYGYDWCGDAIRDGVAYQIMAYTEEEFWYTQIVFTGLPLVCLKADEPISLEEQIGYAAVSGYGFSPIQTDARIRKRGASTLGEPKEGYKVEFAGNSRGGKIEHDVPGIGLESEFALLPMLTDKTMMRDKLSWDLYDAITKDDKAFRARKTQHIELFINDEYMGVYLMINLMDEQEELALAGESHVRNDSVYRSAWVLFSWGRMTVDDPLLYRKGFGYELRSTTKIGREFDDLQLYLDVLVEEDDEAFARRALEIVDLDQLLRYVLFVQACGLTDNIHNNVFIWAQKTQAGHRYLFYPWDLDLSWGLRPDKIGKGFDRWMNFTFADRIINLDAGGARSRLAQIWKEMRKDVFTQEDVAELLEQYAYELSESGAMMRNEMKWNMGMSYPDGYDIIEFAGTRFALLDETVAMIAGTDERLAFLDVSPSETTGVAVFGEASDEAEE